MKAAECFINILVFSNDGLLLMKNCLTQLKPIFEPIKISSVYKIKGEVRSPSHIHDLRRERSFEALTASICGSTAMSPSEIVLKLKEIEDQQTGNMAHRIIELTLLAIEDYEQMRPELTLPHPEIHLRPEYLIPTSEVSKAYTHPIFGKTLRELINELPPKNWGQFFAQGHSVLDF